MQSTLGPLITNKSYQKPDKQSSIPMQNPPPNHNKCLCGDTVHSTAPEDTFLRCINPDCRNVFHKSCMKVIPTNQKYPLFECPGCVLSKSDPLHQVLKTLVPPFLVDNVKRDFLIDQAVLEKIRKSGNLGLEVRSIKLEDRTHDQCWPNCGELLINNIKAMEFRPLQQNSSLKKRKDEKLFTREVKLGLNSVYLKYVKPDPRIKKVEETYIAAVYIVRVLSCEELVKKIQMESKRNVEECKTMIKNDFVSSGLEIAKMSYPMTCVFDMQLIKTPAKGIHCKHINCFSLENFVSVWQKNHQRKWNCPICKVKAYNIVVDTYLENILKELQAADYEDKTQVTVEFNRDASYKFVQDDDDDMDSDSEDEKPKREKPSNTKPEKPLKSTEKTSNIVILDSDEEDAPPQQQAAIVTVQSPVNENSVMQIEPEDFPIVPRQEEPREEPHILTLSSLDPSPEAAEIASLQASPQFREFIEESNNGVETNNGESNKMVEELPAKKSTMEEVNEAGEKSQESNGMILTQKPRSPVEPIMQTQLLPEIIQQQRTQTMPLPGTFQWPASFSKNGSSSQNAPFNLGSQVSQEFNFTQITISSQSNPSKPATPVQIPPFSLSVSKDPVDPSERNEFKTKSQKSASENRDLHRSRQQQASSQITPFSQINDKIERIERILSENEALNPTKKKFNLREMLIAQENGLKEAGRKSNTNRGNLEVLRIDSDNMGGPQKPCSKEALEDVEKSIERLMEYYDAKLDLPSFKNFKSKTFEEILLDKENGFQRSKKLLTTVMKQLPMPTAGIATKTVRPSSELEEMERKYREKPSTSNMYTMSEHKAKLNGRKNKNVGADDRLGNEMNPICLD